MIRVAIVILLVLAAVTFVTAASFLAAHWFLILIAVLLGAIRRRPIRGGKNVPIGT